MKKALPDKIVNMMHYLSANRKCIIIAILALTVIAMTITGVKIAMAVQNFLPDDALSEVNINHNDIVRLGIFRLCFFIFLIACMGVICIMLCINIKLEYIYLAAALCLGFAYMFSITPMSVPDEPHHYQSAHAVAGHIMLRKEPLLVENQYFDYNRLSGHHNVPEAYLRLMDEGVYINQDEATMNEIPRSYDISYPLSYFPQALGIAIARIIGLSFFGVFYLGRFFNLLFYSLCVSFSIKRLKAFQLPLFIIGLLPMSLHQAASYSYDGFINGLSMLFIAYAISCIYEKDIFHWRDYATLLILGILLVPAKLIYLPIIFLVFLVARRWYRTIKGKAWLLATSVALASVIAAYIISFIIYDIGAADTFATGEGGLNWEGEHNYTLSFIISNPIETIIIFLRTLNLDYIYYINGVIGRYLSGLTLGLPVEYILIIIVILIAGCYYGKRDEWQPSIGERSVYILISVMVVGLCMAALLIGWTSDTHIVVLGVQGRYFTPLLPLAALIIRIRRFQISHKIYRNILIAGVLLIQGLIVRYILEYTVNKLH